MKPWNTTFELKGKLTTLLRRISFCVLVLVAQPLHSQAIAVTFDDLPAHSVLPPGQTRIEVAQAVIRALQEADVPSIFGFVNGVRIQEQPEDAAVLDLWRKSGNKLGNHTWSHMNLNEHTAEEFEADLLRNEQQITPYAQGFDWRWLRFPYLAEGETPQKRDAVRQFLAAHHYKIAAVTMSFGDYLWNEPYARCSAQGNDKAIQELEASYLKAASDDADYRRQLARALFGHDIPYVLLMHIGAFDAHMLPRLLAMYRSHGFHFISLAEAEKDPFYSNDIDPLLPGVPDTLEAAAAARHLPPIKHPVDGPPANALCQ